MRIFDSLSAQVKYCFIAGVGALISMLLLGFQFGISNNVFHIPYVLDLPSHPSFHNDEFYHSLQYFTSAVWPLIRLFSNENNVYSVFFVAHIVSRVLAFLFLTVLLVKLGVTQTLSVAISILVLAITPWLQQASSVGGHGMLLNYFTHSELTWPFLLGCLIFRDDGRLLLSSTFAGIVFLINAFVGIWLILILSICWATQSARENWKLVGMQFAVFFVISLPVGIWVFFTLAAAGTPASFSFIQYIRAYFPKHFLIEAASLSALINLFFMLVAGILATMHVRRGEFWRVVLLACAGIFSIGTLAPYLLDSRIIFNLHLLRIDGIIQLLSTVLVVAAAVLNLQRTVNTRQRVPWLLVLLAVSSVDTKWEFFVITLLFLTPYIAKFLWSFKLSSPSALYIKSLGNVDRPAIEALLSVGLWLIWAVGVLFVNGLSYFRLLYLGVGGGLALILLVGRTQKSSNYFPNIIFICLLFLSAFVGAHWRAPLFQAHKITPHAELADLAAWMRLNGHRGIVLLSKETFGYPAFQLESRNPVWVDYKQGAAVMWYPPFYFQWMKRYKEINALIGGEAIQKYAYSNNISYFVLHAPSGKCPVNSRFLAKSGEFLLCLVTRSTENKTSFRRTSTLN